MAPKIISNKSFGILQSHADRINQYKIVDKLEQRIAKLEKVLASHAKCIGEMREEKKDE